MAHTKDWGPEYAGVKALFSKKSGSYRAHERGMEAEITTHDGSHSFGRHGYQTGWEQQLIRAVTGITPDKPFDPRGIDPSIRTWNVEGLAGSSYDEHGEATVSLLAFSFQPTESDYGPGGKPQAAGAFLSPMAQQKAIHLARGALKELDPYPVAHYRHKSHKTNGKPTCILLPVTSCTVVVQSQRTGEPLGVGFRPQSKGSVTPRTRSDVVTLIDGFLNSRTWDEMFPGRTASLNRFHVKHQLAFPNMEDLLDFLGVEPMWQTGARGGFRRAYYAGSKTFGPWNMVTLFPDEFDAGFKPRLFLSPAHKGQLQARNMPQKGYRWTGRTSNFAGTMKKNLQIPPWVNQVP